VSDLIRRAAFHEGGHVTAFHHLGWPVAYAEIREDGTGVVHGLDRLDCPRSCAFISLAGPVAEAIFVGVPVDELLLEDGVCRRDLEMARRHLAEVVGNPEERLRRVIAATERIVRERWPLIERLAEALLVWGRLDTLENSLKASILHNSSLFRLRSIAAS
jgi:hypothetical protein